MPKEPDNNLDEQLKAWAAARRTEAGNEFELHPATRRILQDEVSRTFPSAEHPTESSPGWLALLRPRLAFALSVVAAMVVLGVALWPSLSPARTKGSLVVADRGDKEIQERRNETPLEAATKAPAPMIAAAPRDGQSAPSSVTFPLSRDYRFQEAASAKDSPSSTAKATAEVLQRADTSVVARQVGAEKSQEIAPAKEETKLAELDAFDGKPKVEAFRLKSADAGRQGGVQATPADSKADERALALRPAAGATVESGKRPVAITTPSAPATLEDRQAVLSFQKSQTVAVQNASAPALEAERLQASKPLDATDSATGAATQQFSQVSRLRRNFNSPPMPAVLNSFQLEQRGRQVRIVDADGSVYVGEFNSSAASPPTAVFAAEENTGEPRKAAVPGRIADSDAAAGGGQSADFRVEGINQTLKQQVVFFGNLWMPNSAPVPAPMADTPQRGAVLLQQAASARNAPQQLLPRVQGQATIGSDRIEINAVTSGP